MDDRLRAMARQALADTRAYPAKEHRLRAVALLRHRDDERPRPRLNVYVDAITWAMEHPSAADLPDLSIVATRARVFIKDHPIAQAAWSATPAGVASDEEIDGCLKLGAQVLRVGTGRD